MKYICRSIIVICFVMLAVMSNAHAATFQLPMGEQPAIDGDLSDWASATWIPLDKIFWSTTPYTSDISNAKWTARWCPATNSIYVAVTGIDISPVRTLANGGWDQQDSIEVYVDAANSNYTSYNGLYYVFAQQYVIGVTPSNGVWAVMGDGSTIPSGDEPDISANYTASTYSYEMELVPYNEYGGLSSGLYDTNYVTLQNGKIVGLDVIMDSRTTANEFGMFCNNMSPQKFMLASNFQDHQLVTALGGTQRLVDLDAGYHNGWASTYNSSVWHAQSFAPQQPYLIAFETYHSPNIDVTGNFNLKIYECDSVAADPRKGAPIATVPLTRLKTGSEPSCWVRWELGTPLDVTSYIGQTQPLLIVIEADTAAPSPAINTLGNIAGYGYLDGVYYVFNGSTWTKNSSIDMTFRSYGVEDPNAYESVAIDQKQEVITNGWPLDANHMNLQSFTPIHPYLYAVEVALSGGFTVPGQFTLEIWENNGNLASGVDPRVGTSPIAVSQVNTLRTESTEWVRWEFAPPIDLSAYVDGGTIAPLGFLLRTSAAMPEDMYQLINVNNPYSDGMFHANVNGVWSKYNNYDAVFRTYGSYTLPSKCGDPGTAFFGGDISGPSGSPDCYINLYDLAAIAKDWLSCTEPQDPICN